MSDIIINEQEPQLLKDLRKIVEDIENLETDVMYIKEKINKLETMHNNVSAVVHKIERDEGLINRIDILKGESSELHIRISVLEGESSELYIRISVLETLINRCCIIEMHIEDIDHQIERLTKIVANLERNLELILNHQKQVNQPYKCPVCDGNGRITLKEPFKEGNEIIFSISCHSCKDKGIVWG